MNVPANVWVGLGVSGFFTMLTMVGALLMNIRASARDEIKEAKKDKQDAATLAASAVTRSEAAETQFRADLMKQYQVLADRLDEEEKGKRELRGRIDSLEEERSSLREQARQLTLERAALSVARDELAARVSRIEEERASQAVLLAKAQSDLENAQRQLQVLQHELNNYRERLAQYDAAQDQNNLNRGSS